MDNGGWRGKSTQPIVFVLAVFLGIAAFVALPPSKTSGGTPAVAAIYSGGSLHLTIPYHAIRAGAG